MSEPIKQNRPKTRKQLQRGLLEMLDRTAANLAEHFDSVQIIVTKVEMNGTTSRMSGGSGDIYARTLAAELWAQNADHSIRSSRPI